MTLPNRPGYIVEDKKQIADGGAQNVPQVPDIFPFPNDSAKMAPFHQETPIEPEMHPFQRFDPAAMNKMSLIDSISPEEFQARKNYVRTHRMLPSIVEFLTTCKKEGVTPSAETFTYLHETIQPPNIDFSLDDFLISQGIDATEEDQAEEKGERDEFVFRLEQLKEKYNEELEKLSSVCTEFCSRLFAVLREHSTIRPVSEQEINLKIQAIHQKFDYVKNQLRQNVCNAIVALEKQFNHTKKKRKALPKKAAEVLSNWFFEHLNDPYPSEEEKSMLAAAGGLTITQVNNWFGNKRIRYKRKCLEEEAKRANFSGPTLPAGAANGNGLSPTSPPNIKVHAGKGSSPQRKKQKDGDE
jgi:hypothetical protein